MLPLLRNALLNLLIISFSGCVIVKHYRKEVLTIQSIQAYPKFESPGPAASYYIGKHLANNPQVFEVDAPDKRRFEQILNRSKRTPRLGPKPPVKGLCTILFSNRHDIPPSRIIFLPNVYDSYNLYDMTTGVDYIVRDTADGKWLVEFIEKLNKM